MVELILRLTLGVFFAISGYHKIFNHKRHCVLVETLTHDGIPWVSFNQWFVPGVELLAGLGCIFGLLTPLSALGLLVICVVATVVDGLGRLDAMQPLNAADRLCCLLYLPEVAYAVIALCLVISGGGAYSMDALILSLL